MERAIFLALILVLTISPLPVHSTYHTKTEPHKPAKLKKTHLRFFVHDILSGTKPTAVQIAGTNRTFESEGPTPFGSVFAIDDPLTEGPEITSKAVGNAQGFYLSSNQGKDLTLVMYIDLGFTTGRFKGSSLSVFSRNPVTEVSRREMAVVGGRGKFRFAKGVVFVNTNSLNITNGDAVLEYNVEVIHP